MLDVYKTYLTKKSRLTANVFLFRFQLLEPKQINFKAGQYLILKINNQSRLYSICSPDFIKDSFELIVEIISGGLGSTYLSNLERGEEVNFQGPAGMFTLRQNNKPKIFLATGTGIAPIRSMISSRFKIQGSRLKFKSQNFYLFWGVKTRQDVYFLDELKQLSNKTAGQFKFLICLSREKNLVGLDRRHFILGHINDGLLQQFYPKSDKIGFGRNNLTMRQFNNDFDYYVCGSRQVVSSMVAFLQDWGIDKKNIFFEKF